jgi:hypothetical protein
MSSSRLALPFLRPLLPLTSQEALSSSPSSPSIDLLLILENIHSLKYQKPLDFEMDLQLLKQEIIRRLYDWIQHYEGKKADDSAVPSSSSAPSPAAAVGGGGGGSSSLPIWNISEKNMEIIVSHHSLTKIIYNSFETISESAKNYLFNKELFFQEIEEEKRKRIIETMQQQQQQKAVELSGRGGIPTTIAGGGGGGGKKKGRKPSAVSSKSPSATGSVSVTPAPTAPFSSSTVTMVKEETITATAVTTITTIKSSSSLSMSINNDNDSIVTSSQMLLEERALEEEADGTAADNNLLPSPQATAHDEEEEIETSSNSADLEENGKMKTRAETQTESGNNGEGNDEGEEENEEFKRKEDQCLEKLWRIYCHRDPILAKMELLSFSSSSSSSSSGKKGHRKQESSYSSSDEKISGMLLSSFTTLYYSNNAMNPSFSPSSSSLLVNPRSLRSWIDYLKEGMMPTEYISYSLSSGSGHGRSSGSKGGGKGGLASSSSSSIPSVLQIRNQLLLNDVTAFQKGPEETNETSKFNIFDSKHSKKILKDFLFFNEMDSHSLSLEERKKQQQQRRREKEDAEEVNSGEMEMEMEEKKEELNGKYEKTSAYENVQEEIDHDTQYLVSSFELVSFNAFCDVFSSFASFSFELLTPSFFSFFLPSLCSAFLFCLFFCLVRLPVYVLAK